MVAGAAMFASCTVAQATTLSGSITIAAVTSLWLAACRPPSRMVASFTLLGLAVFVPYFLLVPLIPGPGWPSALAVPWNVLARGLGCMLVATATVTTLTASDLREGLVRLPLPAIVPAILVQIVQQTATLLYETRRVASAMAVRGATTGGLAALRVLASLPVVWLPRIIERAERLGAAMELRGYCDAPRWSFGRSAPGPADAAALGLSLSTIAAAVAVRLLGGA
jgi:energy-coupling factor transporter transmembrane protein EcfT